jgi:hypothetical protein
MELPERREGKMFENSVHRDIFTAFRTAVHVGCAPFLEVVHPEIVAFQRRIDLKKQHVPPCVLLRTNRHVATECFRLKMGRDKRFETIAEHVQVYVHNNLRN